ncbi:MAG TPA: ATP synthase A1 subunit C [Methanomassiliicoccales archaeon]|nr:ATP synthase A1 subunit C [Methanomassiliicoccales archaeon]
MALGFGKRGNYPYACARIRAKKSLLLTKENYPKLLMMDLNEIGRFLGETQYNVEMTELASRYSGVNLIELGTSRNLARMYNGVLGFTKGELRDMIAGYLERWDVWNLKTVLRGKYYGASAEEIREDLVPAGRLNEDDLNELMSLESVTDVLEKVMKLDWVIVPQDAITSLQTTGRLSGVEDYLDKAYYEHLIDSINPNSKPEKILLGYVRKEIDANNLMVILKLKKEGLAPEKISPYLIAGGDELTKKEMERLIALESFEALVQELQKYSFYEYIKEALEKASTTNSLNEVTLAIKKLQATQAQKFSHLYPLSVLPIIDYIIRKKIEVDNIRIIARCKESGLDPDTIKKLLVI